MGKGKWGDYENNDEMQKLLKNKAEMRRKLKQRSGPNSLQAKMRLSFGIYCIKLKLNPLQAFFFNKEPSSRLLIS